MSGFFIDKLIYNGNGLQDVIVGFKKGINAIIGSSDTGKSFVFKSIDFMFGKEELKRIDESKDYDTLFMVLNIGSDNYITLKRAISKGSILYVYRCAYEDINGKTPEKYSRSANAKESMNKFYYSLIGVSEPYYIHESKDKTKKFTIRYLIKYFMLNENQITEDTYSPVLISRQNHMRYFDRNAFDFLISNYNKTEKRTQRQDNSIMKIENQLELIDSMIEEYSERLKNKELELDLIYVDDVDLIIKSLKDELIKVQSDIRTLSRAKIIIGNNINSYKIQIENLDETQQRFVILNQQYQNELERYEFIYQGSHLINQLPKRKCPVCDNDFSVEEINSDEMFEAMNIEKGIINKKQIDLNASIHDIKVEIESINEEIKEQLEKLEVVNREISTLTQNDLSNIDQQLTEYIQHEQLASEIVSHKDDIERLMNRRKILESKTASGEDVEQTPNVTYDDLVMRGIDLLCSKIAVKLEKWLYHEEVKVSFDESFDLVINGKARSTFGKGYRSIIHSAYYLAMFDIMKEVGAPSYNFMIIDSPLTAYTDKEVRQNDDIVVSDKTIKDFYDDLQNEYSDSQIIIIDNKQVPKNSNVHEIHFSHSNDVGTYGLFPVK